MRWSVPLDQIASHVLARQGLSFWVQARRLPVPSRRIYFLLEPLNEVTQLGHNEGPMPNCDRNHWLVWQSETSSGCGSALPTDGGRLATELGFDIVSRSIVRGALQDLMAAI